MQPYGGCLYGLYTNLLYFIGQPPSVVCCAHLDEWLEKMTLRNHAFFQEWQAGDHVNSRGRLSIKGRDGQWVTREFVGAPWPSKSSPAAENTLTYLLQQDIEALRSGAGRDPLTQAYGWCSIGLPSSRAWTGLWPLAAASFRIELEITAPGRFHSHLLPHDAIVFSGSRPTTHVTRVERNEDLDSFCSEYRVPLATA